MTDPTAIQPSELDQLPDRDPEETAEWQASLDAVTKAAGPHRAAYLMRRTLERAEGNGLALPKLLETDYVNTIPTAAEPVVDGDEAMETRITAWNRWNAAAMVTRGSETRRRRPHRHLRLRGLALRDRLQPLLQGQGGATAPATSSTSRATPPPASTPAPSSTAG